MSESNIANKVDPGESSTLSVVGDNLLPGVPAPIRNIFWQTCRTLIGEIVALPTAKLQQYTQSIKDTTEARSIISRALTHAVVEESVKNPALLLAAGDAYTPTIVRKIQNRLNVAMVAAEKISNAASEPTPEASTAPDEDWLNTFTRLAEDASSERLQLLFGQILAGQITNRGKFSVRTLRAVSELDQQTADDFTRAWGKSLGDSVDYSDYWRLGEGFTLWKRLAEAGLMAESSAISNLPNFVPISELGNLGLWSPVNVSEKILLVYRTRELTQGWQFIGFTRVGRELGSILPAPDYTQNLRELGKRLPKPGIQKVELLVPSAPPEVIWPPTE